MVDTALAFECVRFAKQSYQFRDSCWQEWREALRLQIETLQEVYISKVDLAGHEVELHTSRHSFKAMAAVKRTTESVPGPRSFSKWTNISQIFGLLGEALFSKTHFPISHAIRRLMIG